MKLTRYWFTFEHDDSPSILNMGCGITAFDEADAVGLLTADVFSVLGTRVVATIVPDIDVQTLDRGHVISNMLPPNLRGVWFPRMI